MKRMIIYLFTSLFLLFLCQPLISAAPIKASPEKVQAGDGVTVSGTAAADALVSVKVLDEEGDIVYFSIARSDTKGAFGYTFYVPDLPPQTLTVIAGNDTDTGTAPVQIIAPAANPPDSDSGEEIAGSVTTEKPLIPETGVSCSFIWYLILSVVLII